MGSIEELNVEVIFYNNEVKVFRTELNLLVPEVYNHIQNIFLDPLNDQILYTKMEIKHNGRVIATRDIKEQGLSIYG